MIYNINFLKITSYFYCKYFEHRFYYLILIAALNMEDLDLGLFLTSSDDGLMAFLLNK